MAYPDAPTGGESNKHLNKLAPYLGLPVIRSTEYFGCILVKAKLAL